MKGLSGFLKDYSGYLMEEWVVGQQRYISEEKYYKSLGEKWWWFGPGAVEQDTSWQTQDIFGR